MRRALAVAIATLAFAAPAQAQSGATPVVGGGSFNAAPILQPGAYRDTILPHEYLYYGFKLEPGQRLRVTLEPQFPNSVARALDVIYFSGAVVSPSRTRNVLSGDPDDNDNLGFGSLEHEPLVVTGDEASADIQDDTSGEWEGAGVYFFTLHATYNGSPPAPRAELPFAFTAEVLGAAQPSQTPTPTPTPTPTATPQPDKTTTSDDGPKPEAAAIAGVGGILLGAIGGLALRQRRR